MKNDSLAENPEIKGNDSVNNSPFGNRRENDSHKSGNTFLIANEKSQRTAGAVSPAANSANRDGNICCTERPQNPRGQTNTERRGAETRTLTHTFQCKRGATFVCFGLVR